MCINSVAFSYSSELNWLSFSTFFCLSSIVNCVYLIRMTHIGGRGRFTLFFVFMMIDKYSVDFCKYPNTIIQWILTVHCFLLFASQEWKQWFRYNNYVHLLNMAFSEFTGRNVIRIGTHVNAQFQANQQIKVHR